MAKKLPRSLIEEINSCLGIFPVMEQFLQTTFAEMEAMKAENEALKTDCHKKLKAVLEASKAENVHVDLKEAYKNLEIFLQSEEYLTNSPDKTTTQSASVPSGSSKASVAESSSANLLGLKQAPTMHSFNLSGQHFVIPSDTESVVFSQHRKRALVQGEVELEQFASTAKHSRVDFPGSSRDFPAPAAAKAQYTSPSKSKQRKIVAKWDFCGICYTFRTLGSAHSCKGQPVEWLHSIHEAMKRTEASAETSGQLQDDDDDFDGAAGGGDGGPFV